MPAITPACQEWYSLRLVRGHPARGVVGVTLRTERHVDHERPTRLLLPLCDGRDEVHRAAVRVRELVERVAELIAPGGVRAPRGRLDHESGSVPPGDLEVGLVVARERGTSLLRLEERKRGEAGELEAVEEDERRLHAAVGEQDVAVQLWEFGSIAHSPEI